MSVADAGIAEARLNVAVIVAHPDDEVLWCGEQILMLSNWNWTVVTMGRGSGPDRAPRFERVMERLAENRI